MKTQSMMLKDHRAHYDVVLRWPDNEAAWAVFALLPIKGGRNSIAEYHTEGEARIEAGRLRAKRIPHMILCHIRGGYAVFTADTTPETFGMIGQQAFRLRLADAKVRTLTTRLEEAEAAMRRMGVPGREYSPDALDAAEATIIELREANRQMADSMGKMRRKLGPAQDDGIDGRTEWINGRRLLSLVNAAHDDDGVIYQTIADEIGIPFVSIREWRRREHQWGDPAHAVQVTLDAVRRTCERFGVDEAWLRGADMAEPAMQEA